MGKNSTGFIQLDENQLDELREKLRHELMSDYGKDLADYIFDAAVALNTPILTEEGIREHYERFARYFNNVYEHAYMDGRWEN